MCVCVLDQSSSVYFYEVSHQSSLLAQSTGGGHELSDVELYLIANTKLKIFLNPWIRTGKTVSTVDFSW